VPLLELSLDTLASSARLPGSRTIPAARALRASLALKLRSIERKSRVMALIADEGLALFAGLNAFPKKSHLSEYSSRVTHAQTLTLLGAYHKQLGGADFLAGHSFNLDFDMALLVIASSLYRLLARKMRGYNIVDAAARPLLQRRRCIASARRHPPSCTFCVVR
jgi:hypothetical protein